MTAGELRGVVNYFGEVEENILDLVQKIHTKVDTNVTTVLDTLLQGNKRNQKATSKEFKVSEYECAPD